MSITTPFPAREPPSEIAHAPCAATIAPRWFASHEIRTPLQAIKGGVELLLEARGAGLCPDMLDAITLIATAVTDLERQIGLLGELAALAHAPPSPPRAIALRELVALPELARVLGACATPRALPETVRLLVAPDPLARALDLLAEVASGSPEGVTCDQLDIGATVVRLRIRFVACGSGAGSVALRLARELIELAAVVVDEHTATGLALSIRRC